jgi:hypothetical protein
MDTGGSSPITSPNPPSATPDVPVGDPLLDPHSAAPATATTSAVRTAMEHLNWGAPVEYLFQGTAFRPQRVMPWLASIIDANNSYVWHPKCYSLFSADDKDTIRGVCIETPTEIARDLHHKKDSSATPFFPRILVFSMRVPDKDGKMEYRYLYFFRRHPGATLPVERTPLRTLNPRSTRSWTNTTSRMWKMTWFAPCSQKENMSGPYPAFAQSNLCERTTLR